jgi:glutathione S-transferase
MALANHLGLDCEIRIVNLAAGEQHKPEFAALNPNERMPVLEDGNFVLWESNAILQYLASKNPASGVWPADARGQADVLRWLLWESADWFPACAVITFERLVKKLLNLGEPDPGQVAKGEAQFHKLAPVLNNYLKGRKWLVGDRLTIADFAVGAPMAVAQPSGYPVQNYGEINRWYATIAELPAWQKALAAAH